MCNLYSCIINNNTKNINFNNFTDALYLYYLAASDMFFHWHAPDSETRGLQKMHLKRLEMTRAWTRSCAACCVRKGLIFLMLCSANLQDRAVFAMCSLKVLCINVCYVKSSLLTTANQVPVHASVVIVSSPLRHAAMAILHLSVNPILQNRYPITVKCLNIGTTIYRSISNIDTASGTRTEADRICAVAWYSNISSKADRGDIFIVTRSKIFISHTPTLGRNYRSGAPDHKGTLASDLMHATACKYLRIMRIMMRNVLRCCDVSVLLQMKR